MSTRIDPSHQMHWVRSEIIYVCTRCMFCDCHHFEELTKPCGGDTWRGTDAPNAESGGKSTTA